MFGCPATAMGGHVMPPMKTIVPSRAAKLIEKALLLRGDEMVKFGATMNDITVETSQCVIFARLIEGRFPNWRNTIPKWRDPSEVRVVNGPLLAALRQAAIATSSESQGVDMTFIGGSIRMDARTDEVGESSVSMIADCDLACGETLTMRVDNRYVREFCGVVSPEASVKLLFGRVVEPLLLEVEDGYQYVIMPMAVDRG
jgi:DNA polymerase-3 subunit beta